MSEQSKPFIVTDRRKFNADGSSRPDADPSPERPPRDESSASHAVESPSPVASSQPAMSTAFEQPTLHAEVGEDTYGDDSDGADCDDTDSDSDDPETGLSSDHGQPTVAGQGQPEMPPPPTPEQMDQAKRAYRATSDRLDTALRATNPAGPHPPAIRFDSLVQSIYMSAIVQMGGATPEGQQPQIDLLGARQSIDMLGVLAERVKGNLSESEQTLLDSALFELRLGFLDMTQALARQAASRQQQPGAPGAPGLGGGAGGFDPGAPGGPRIVR